MNRRRHGVIYVTALGIILVLGGMLIALTLSMRTNSLASANRMSYLKADAIEQGAERWVLAQVESYQGDSVTLTEIPAEALQVGSGYFWILRPDPDTDQSYQFGLTDESGKLNINAATADELNLLPGMEQDIADSILEWRSEGSTTASDGADSGYYESLPEPYEAKNAPFETVEELMLIKDVTPEILFGSDLNRDGVVDDVEHNAGGMGAMFNGASGTSRGIFNDVTVYSVEPNTTASGKPRLNVNNANTTGLLKLLQTVLTPARGNAIIGRISPLITAAKGKPIFASLADFYTLSGMTIDEFSLVADTLTATTKTTLTGLININTAPREVLMCLPGLSQSDADSLISKRGGSTGSIAMVMDALTPDKATQVISLVTARSFQYSADIVAVSGDGRSFKRVRIVVDSRQLPAKIVYRRDLTSLGWPLPQQIRDAMRNGQAPPTGLSGSTVNFGH